MSRWNSVLQNVSPVFLTKPTCLFWACSNCTAPPTLHCCAAWLVSAIAFSCRMTKKEEQNSSTESHSYLYLDTFASIAHFLVIQIVYIFLFQSPLGITAHESYHNSCIIQSPVVFSPKEGSDVKCRLSTFRIVKGCVSSCAHCRDHKMRCSAGSKNSSLKHGIR